MKNIVPIIFAVSFMWNSSLSFAQQTIPTSQKLSDFAGQYEGVFITHGGLSYHIRFDLNDEWGGVTKSIEFLIGSMTFDWGDHTGFQLVSCNLALGDLHFVILDADQTHVSTLDLHGNPESIAGTLTSSDGSQTQIKLVKVSAFTK